MRPLRILSGLILLLAMTTLPATGQDLAKLRGLTAEGLAERFKKLDKNGDGKLEKSEFPYERLFKLLDKDGDGYISAAESKALLKLTGKMKEQEKKPEEPLPELPDSSLAREKDRLTEAPRILRPGERGIGRLIPQVSFRDVSGKEHRLADLAGDRVLVVAWTSTSCPVSQKYLPTLARLEKSYREKGVHFLFVNATASDEKADIQKAIATHALNGPYVHDATGNLSAALQATTTADVLVIQARNVVYQGAVDDQYGVGYSRDAAQVHHLENALQAILASTTPRVRATTAPGCVLDFSTSTVPATTITYHNRISRIVQDACQECHRKGGEGPFALDTYKDLVSRKGMLRRVVERNTMPPWFAVTAKGQHSPWANDRSLPERDRADLLAWLASDMPQGDPKDAPPSRTYPEGWRIGKPDVVYQLGKPVHIKATGTMAYQNVTVKTDQSKDHWIQAVEIQPTARQVVHHVLVFVQDGKAGLLRRGVARDADDERQGFFAAYVPGNTHQIYPDGFAKKLPAGATLRFQIHYTPNGTATTDQLKIGMVFATKPVQHEIKVAGISSLRLSIPPGAENHAQKAELRVPADVKLLAFMPHLHLRGKAVRYDLIDKDTTTLLDIPRYDFNWQLTYRLADPLNVPRGSTVRFTAWYDNSAKNPANPDPTKTVRWGPQTTDEMLLGYVEYYIPGGKK